MAWISFLLCSMNAETSSRVSGVFWFAYSSFSSSIRISSSSISTSSAIISGSNSSTPGFFFTLFMGNALLQQKWCPSPLSPYRGEWAIRCLQQAHGHHWRKIVPAGMRVSKNVLSLYYAVYGKVIPYLQNMNFYTLCQLGNWSKAQTGVLVIFVEYIAWFS